ncbi:MAG TPA: FAD:protein FMN transferase [Solirubrobacterales bacterium]|nr:FAD:protein FMN transferase [Solirubrobacterales bacterium]
METAARLPLAVSTFATMGTEVRLLAPPDGIDEARSLVEALFGEWDRRFSRFRGDSELAGLNAAAGRPFPVSGPMLDVVEASLTAARLTDGLFDPTLLHRLEELGYDASFERLPPDRAAAPLTPWSSGAWRAIRLDRAGGTIQLPDGVALDLGGIAKGMAVDAALGQLRQAGIAPAAVNAGGDLAVLGTPPASDGWAIEIEGIAEPVALDSGALATSSRLRRRWRVGGEARHHLIDPRTGLPAAGEVVSATVAAGSCRAAEVAAKVALLLAPTEASLFIGRHRLTALLLLENGSAWRLGEWREAAA